LRRVQSSRSEFEARLRYGPSDIPHSRQLQFISAIECQLSLAACPPLIPVHPRNPFEDIIADRRNGRSRFSRYFDSLRTRFRLILAALRAFGHTRKRVDRPMSDTVDTHCENLFIAPNRSFFSAENSLLKIDETFARCSDQRRILLSMLSAEKGGSSAPLSRFFAC